MEYIRRSRGVPAKRGGLVTYTGGDKPREGRILSAHSGYLMILLEGDKYPGTFHPTWELEYHDARSSDE